MSEVKKDFEKTDYKCPECGEPIFKHFHRRDHISTQTYEWYCYYCFNLCWLDCRNCRYRNTHGECDLDFCMNYNNWKPKISCSNCRWYKCNDCDLGNDIYKKCKDFEVAP